MRAVLRFICALVLVISASACSSTSEQALAPARDARAALASGSLAWQQYTDGATLPTTSITTLRDMLKAISDAETELVELPAKGDDRSQDALRAVREADDAVASAVATAVTGGSPDGISDLLKAATHDLDSAIEALQ